MSVHHASEIPAPSESPILLPSFSDKVHALIALRDEAQLTSEQLQEIVEAMIDQAVRSHSTLSPALVVIQFRADLRENGIPLAA